MRWDQRGGRRERARKLTRSIAVAIFLLVLAAPPASAATVVIDGAGGPGGRTTHPIGPKTAAARFDGNLNLFSYDAAAGNLRWGVRHPTGWTFSTIDGAGGASGRIDANVGEDQAAIVFGGALHVLYYDRTHGDLRDGRYDGSSWTFRTLDGGGGAAGRVDANVGLRLSAALFDGGLRAVYANTSGGDVRLASLSGGTWTFRTLDGRGGGAGRVDANVGWNTAVSVYGGRLHVFYLHQDPTCDIDCHVFGWIREAHWDGSTWHYRVVDAINCCMPDQSLTVARLSGDDVWLFYENFGLTTQNLRAKHWNGSSWSNVGCVGEPFEPDDIVGGDASSAVVNGVVRVTYYDVFSTTFGGAGVAHTSFDGDTWRTALVGIEQGAPDTSVVAGALLVFVGDATIDDVAATHDLVLSTPPATGMVVPPDPSCG